MKIMVAEDDPCVRDSLSMMLKMFGYDVVAVCDGEEAWDVFIVDPVPIIISDWIMPITDGLELCQKIRKGPTSTYCYFILLTGVIGTEKYRQAMNSGVDDFLSKPFAIDEISIRLRVAKRIVRYMERIQNLEKLLPICSHCRKIRDENDQWQDFEEYIEKQTSSRFTHGICDGCLEDYF